MRFGKEPTPYMDPKIWKRNKTSSEGISYGFWKTHSINSLATAHKLFECDWPFCVVGT